MDDNFDKIIQEKFEALRNLNLEDSGLLRAKEFHQIIKTQMDLTISLSEQHHKDIMKLSKSSKILEKLTYVLIGLTASLIGITIIDIIIMPK